MRVCTYFSSASNLLKSAFSNNSLIKVLKFDVFLLLTTNESQMLFSRSVSTLSSWLRTGQHVIRMCVYNWYISLSQLPGHWRVQREREERVPERVVDGDLQLAGQPQQTVVVGQLAVTGSGAHGDDEPAVLAGRPLQSDGCPGRYLPVARCPLAARDDGRAASFVDLSNAADTADGRGTISKTSTRTETVNGRRERLGRQRSLRLSRHCSVHYHRSESVIILSRSGKRLPASWLYYFSSPTLPAP